MNCKMPALRAAFEAAGFEDVATLLSSGNVVFTATRATEAALEKRAEAAMSKQWGQALFTIVRPVDALRDLLAADPYRGFRMKPGAKRVVTFLRHKPSSQIALPVELEGARILATTGREFFTTYVRTPKGPVFMTLIERTLGKEQTTRTWETVAKVAR